MSTVSAALSRAKAFCARLDAELLLAKILQQPRGFLFAYPEAEITTEQIEQYQSLIKKRQEKIPLAYLLGEKEFWSLPLKINPHVLVPRPETELLVEKILADYSNEASISLIDLGTGSGAIAIALAHERPGWNIIASDFNNDALKLAQQNATQLLDHAILFLQSNWLEQFPCELKVEVIVSNPPYLAHNDPHLFDSEISHEPSSALVAADNGLENYKIIAAQARAFLKPLGRIYFEHGAEQAEAVTKILMQLGYVDVEHYADLAGLPRVTVGSV
jgi:release factor glutamine methyltransferase